MKNYFMIFLSIVLLSTACGRRHRRPHRHHDPDAPQWVLLGQRKVTHRTERDDIHGLLQGRFKAIRLAVERNGVHINILRIVFGNGEKMNVPVRRFIPEGGQTRNIQLPGERIVKRVVLIYSSHSPAKRRAIVKVWGQR